MADRTHDRLAALDPARHDEPPAPGSERLHLIQEKAMQTLRDPVRGTPTPTPSPPRRRPPWRALQVAAAVVVAAVSAVLVTGRDFAPAAAAVIRAAAEDLEAVETLRATLTQVAADGEVWIFEGEFAGDDSHQAATVRTADGVVTAEWELLVVGATSWRLDDGEVSEGSLGPDERLAPFSISSAAVLEAALEGADVEHLGREPVRGIDADRYRIELTDESRTALSRLSAGQLAWFSLEDPPSASAVEVWVSDGLVRRVEVTFGDGYFLASSATELYDFGAPISIQPPP